MFLTILQCFTYQLSMDFFLLKFFPISFLCLQVIYSLNTKNEEQEATLQMLLHVTTDTADNLQPTTNQYEERPESTSALRTRLLELQATVEEVEKTYTHLQTHTNSKYAVCQKRNEL